MSRNPIDVEFTVVTEKATRHHEPVVSPGGIGNLLMVIAMIFASYWTFQGVKAIVQPIVKGAFSLIAG